MSFYAQLSALCGDIKYAYINVRCAEPTHQGPTYQPRIIRMCEQVKQAFIDERLITRALFLKGLETVISAALGVDSQ